MNARRLALAASLLALAPLAAGQGDEAEEPERGPVLTAETAEHLCNRLGFGARPEELAPLIGRRALDVLDGWVEASEPPVLMERAFFTWQEYGYDQAGLEIKGAAILELPREEIIERQAQMRLIDKRQFRVYLDDWFAQLIRGEEQLRERMALFWHGFFPTSSTVVLRRYEIIGQHHFLRTHALGSYRTLLHGMVEDPAMLGFFDNDTNSKEHPNENFARELLELYSLGIGHYTEEDVRQAARALTGYQGESGQFVLAEDLHDYGEKTILGSTGNFDGSDLVDLLLEQDACASYVTTKLLTWLEGAAPAPERVARYAETLRTSDYEILPVLRALVVDPAFYRPEVVGTRVQSPVDYLVGAARRLDLRGREPALFFGATLAGQQIYGPPSVKGWNEGRGWITSSSIATRADSIGLLLGLLQAQVVEPVMEGEEPSADAERILALEGKLRARGFGLHELRGQVAQALGEDATDEELIGWIAEAWLARSPTSHTLAALRTELAFCRERYDTRGPLLQSAHADRILCHLAHALLRLPIAQLG